MLPNQSARELTSASWGQELAKTLRRCNSRILKMKEEQAEDEQQYQEIYKISIRLQSTLRDIWIEAPTDVFDVG